MDKETTEVDVPQPFVPLMVYVFEVVGVKATPLLMPPVQE
jgi:hypothetical protein